MHEDVIYLIRDIEHTRALRLYNWLIYRILGCLVGIGVFMLLAIVSYHLYWEYEYCILYHNGIEEGAIPRPDNYEPKDHYDCNRWAREGCKVIFK